MNWKNILWVLLIIFIIYTSYFLYKQFKKNMPVEKFDEPKLKITLYYAEWCNHCVEFRKSGTFTEIYEKLKVSPKYSAVIFEELDYDKNKELAKKHGVSSFPSIVAISGEGTLIDNFTGDRYDKNALQNFVDKCLSQV